MESSASARRAASAVLDPRRWRALALLCGAFFMVLIDGISAVLAEKSTDMADLLVSNQDMDVPAERVINLDPDAWYQTLTAARMGEGNHDDVWAAVHHPAVVHGMCEDYRAGLRADRAHEEADRAAGRQIDGPTLLLNATDDDIGIHGDSKRILEPWVAGSLSSAAIHSGHHEAEQAPDELARTFRDFFVSPMQPASQP